MKLVINAALMAGLAGMAACVGGSVAQDLAAPSVSVKSEAVAVLPVPLNAPDRPSVLLSEAEEYAEQWEYAFDQLIVRNVSRPALYPILPDPQRAKGQAVIVAPGGAYHFVSLENEGFPVGERLAEEGYTAFVLKYRTRPTPRDGSEFLAEMGRLFSGIGRRDLPPYEPAIEDLSLAMSYVETACPELGCDAQAIGLIGFSAGAYSVIRMLEEAGEEGLIGPAALVYPPMSNPIGAGARPPLFLAIAIDDPLFGQGGLTLPEAWLEDEASLEFHLYADGGHGFGTLGNSTTSTLWLDQYIAWLDMVIAPDEDETP